MQNTVTELKSFKIRVFYNMILHQIVMNIMNSNLNIVTFLNVNIWKQAGDISSLQCIAKNDVFQFEKDFSCNLFYY